MQYSSILVSINARFLSIFGHLNEEPIWVAQFLLLRRFEEGFGLLDQTCTLVVVRLFLDPHDISVSCRDFCDENVHHDHEHDHGGEEEEEFCGDRHSSQFPLHVEFSQAEQELFFDIVNEIFLAAVIHDEEGAAECGQDDEVEQKERLHIHRDFQEHVHKETSLAEDAQEVEHLDPHEETGKTLHHDVVFG